MRAVVVVLACAAVFGCGSVDTGAVSDGGTGSGGGSDGGPAIRQTLHLRTTGNGLIRGSTADCRGSCDQPFDNGAVVHLTAVPDSGWTFSGWSGDCGGNGTCDLAMNADHTVTAAFAQLPPPPPPSQHTLSLTVQGSGTVTSAPGGINCPGTCSAQFYDGAQVTLTAVAASGWQFSGWSGACSGTSCVIGISGDAAATATFTQVPPPPPPPPARHTLSVAVQGSGTVTSAPDGITCPGSCSAAYDDGTQVTLTASAASGWQFGGWSGACSGPSCVIAMNGDAAATATFTQIPVPTGGYSVVEIPGVDGDSDLSPASINRAGDVVGSYTTKPLETHAFLFRAATGTSERIAADGTDQQGATGINSSGQVSIWTDSFSTPPSREGGSRWQGGAETSIGALPPGPNGPNSGANAINESGWIAGWSLGSANWQRAVLWDGTTLHDLGSLAGNWSMAYALNGSGVVVGETNVPGEVYPHAAAFYGGTIRDLGTLGSLGSTAWGVNDSGRVVGSTSTASGVFHAFVYDLPDGPMRDVSPTQACTLRAINAGGDAVGACSTAPRVGHAALWHGGRMIDLNDAITDPSWVLTAAQAINDSGRITGTGMHAGAPRAFILVPR